MIHHNKNFISNLSLFIKFKFYSLIYRDIASVYFDDKRIIRSSIFYIISFFLSPRFPSLIFFKRLKNYKPVSLTCTTLITGAKTKNQTIAWAYDGKTVSFQGFPVKMGRHGDMKLKKLDGKDKFEYTIYSILGPAIYTIDFYNRRTSTSAFGGKWSGTCF